MNNRFAIKKILSFLLALLIALPSPALAAGIKINAGAEINVPGTSGIVTNGDWVNAGAFTPGSGTVTLTGTSSATVTQNGGSFNNLTIIKQDADDADDNVTVDADMVVAGTLHIQDGEMIQTTADLTLTTVNMTAKAEYLNEGTGDLTLGGDINNDGLITFDASGGGPDDPDDILIRSTVFTTQRNWQGSGLFNMTDVDVQDETAIGGTPPYIYVATGTDSGNNVNWVFGGGDLSDVSVTLTSNQAGIEDDVTVAFTTQYLIPDDGRIQIDFDRQFDADGLTSVTNVAGIDGTYTVTVQDGDGTNDLVILTRNGDGSLIPGGTEVEIILEDEVRNPQFSQTSADYEIQTQIFDGRDIDTGTAAGSVITPAILPSR